MSTVRHACALEARTAGNDSNTGSFVFSEDEYRTGYAAPYRWSNLMQIGLLDRHKGLVIGLSLQDTILRRLIDVIQAGP